MQRLHDTGPSPPLTPPGFANTKPASSAQPNSALKARHASAYPTVSHHNPHMIMKAARRSSGLPSLVIAVPPSSSSDVAIRANGADAKPRPAASTAVALKDTGDRTKTVTFFYPEEDEEEGAQSDHSSICQSPSWAVYGQNKKKDKKREAAQRKKEQDNLDKVDKNWRKKRLTKLPPQGNPESRPLAPAKRSLSEPVLEKQQKPNERSHNRLMSHYPPDSMTNIHNLLKVPPPEEDSKPQSKGLFAGFRLSRSSTGTVQKAESQSRSSMDDTGSVRGGAAFGTQWLGPRGDMDFLNPRKPPSIKSTQSSPTQSQSSQEHQMGKSRKSFTHGRSHSLLSRLKGPSYLYAKNSESGEEVLSQPLQSFQQGPHANGTATEAPAHNPNSFHAISSNDSSQDLNDKQVGSSRGRQAQAHVPQPRDSSSDYEDAIASDSQRQHARQPMLGSPVANEGRRRPPTYVQQARFRYQGPTPREISPQRSVSNDQHNDRFQVTRRKPSISQPAKPVHYQAAVMDHPTPTMSPHSDKSYATVYTDAIEQLSDSHSSGPEVNQHSDYSHKLTVQPVSNQEEWDAVRANRKPLESTSPPFVGLESMRSPNPKTATEPEVDGEQSHRRSHLDANRSQPSSGHFAQPALVPSKPADYFTFISESYAPPSLELRSPIEEEQGRSQHYDHELSEEAFDAGDPAWAALSDQIPASQSSEDLAKVMDGLQDESGENTRPLDFCDSPTLSAYDADGNVPAIDRAEMSPTMDKVLLKTPTFGTVLETEQSRSASERSSSSTCNDVPQSPSTATTPDVSRPQSDIGASVATPKVSVGVMDLREEEPARNLPDSRVLGGSRSRPTSRGDSLRHATSVADSLQGGHRTMISTTVKSHDIPLSPTLGPFANSPRETMAEEEEEEVVTPIPRRQPLEPRAQSAVDLTSTGTPIAWKHRPQQMRETAAFSSVSLPNSPPPELESEARIPRRSALKLPRNNSSTSQESLSMPSSGAAYLQEARKAAPLPHVSASRALRPAYSQKPSVPHLRNSQSSERKGDPIAKVLVQCCNCQFFHDMPSAVYECMAKPDSIVEDKRLGVSAAISTTVKCPWCAHGMTTHCCAGYTAIVILKEKLHGK